MADGKRWYVYFRYKDWTGATKQHKKEGFTRKSDAQEYEKDYLARVTGSSDMTIRNLYLIYMEDCRTRLKPTTHAGKEFLFESHVLPYLADRKASEITPGDIRQWQNTLLNLKQPKTGTNYSQTYLKTIHNQVSALLNFGVKYHGLKQNPCHIAGSMGKKNATAMQFWTVAEFEQFLEAVSNKPNVVVMFSLLFWTGMRSGEMLALTASDFDFNEHSVSITKNYARHQQQDLILEPKTPKSRRVILMPPTLSKLIQNFIDSQYGLAPDVRIFGSNTKFILQHEMKRGCTNSGIKKIRVHDLRHSHASLLIEMNYSPLLIAERLGHEKIETTLQTYSHLYPNKQTELAKELEKLQKCYEFATATKS